MATANDNRDALVDYWIGNSKIEYTNSSDPITLGPETITVKENRIIKTSKDLTINANIVYDNDVRYDSVSQIPKLIISANNITISCNVSMIDAILIAKNNINTCNSYGSGEEQANEAERNNQLRIRGAVIANSLTPSRTHGAGIEGESAIPAEIINYDSSVMLWAQYMAGNDDSAALTVTYQRELAPRY